MMAEFTIDYTGVLEMLSNAKGSLQDLVPVIMAKALDEIRRLASSGFNVDGEALQAYSEEYIKQRLKAGKSASPNLKSSGEMLASLRISKVTANKWEIKSSGRNKLKLIHLENVKNYYLMVWGKRLEEIIDRELDKWEFF